MPFQQRMNSLGFRVVLRQLNTSWLNALSWTFATGDVRGLQATPSFIDSGVGQVRVSRTLHRCVCRAVKGDWVGCVWVKTRVCDDIRPTEVVQKFTSGKYHYTSQCKRQMLSRKALWSQMTKRTIRVTGLLQERHWNIPMDCILNR